MGHFSLHLNCRLDMEEIQYTTRVLSLNPGSLVVKPFFSCASVLVHMYTHTYTYTDVQMPVHVCIHMCMYICTCMCMCVYVCVACVYVCTRCMLVTILSFKTNKPPKPHHTMSSVDLCLQEQCSADRPASSACLLQAWYEDDGHLQSRRETQGFALSLLL